MDLKRRISRDPAPQGASPAPLQLQTRAQTYFLIIGVVLGVFMAGIAVPLIAGEPAGTSVGLAGGAPTAPSTVDAGGFATEPGEAGESPLGLPGEPGEGGAVPGEAGGPTAPGAGPAGPGVTGSGVGPAPSGQAAAGPPVKVGIAILDLGQVGRLGFDSAAVDAAAERKVFEKLVADENAAGGINGRPIEAHYDTYDPLSESSMRETCLRFTQDAKVFMAMAPGGFVGAPVLCFTEEHRTPFVFAGSSGVPQEYYTRSRGLLFTGFMGEQRVMWNFADQVNGVMPLRGKKIGIIFDLRSGPESVAATLKTAIEQLGGEVVHTSVFSADLGTASGQVPIEVQRHQTAGSQLIFNAANALVIAQFTQQAQNQQYFPTYFTSDWNGGNSDFYYTGVADSFDGMLNFTAQRVNEYTANLPESEPDRRCREVAQQALGRELTRDEAVAFNRACAMWQMSVGGMRAAGSNLTPQTFSAGMQTLGRMDLPAFGGGALTQGRFDAADHVRTMRWQADCRCIVPVSGFRQTRY